MTQSKSFTSRVLSYIEPYYIDGVAKVAFYTEVNTNIQIDDKVFISNGYFDSNYYINKGKWVKNADGYRVLYVDRCKIVVDINYNSSTGSDSIYSGVTQSYKTDDIDNFIKIYNIKSQREFDYINKITIDTYSQKYSKFAHGYTNNIIYSESVQLPTGSGIGKNTGLNLGGDFWARNGIIWDNTVTNSFLLNSFTFTPDYYAAGLTNNGRIYIIGSDIEYNGDVYKERNIYKYDSLGKWVIDTDYKQPVISKLNFKKGMFQGTHNDGIFGSYDKTENWYGSQSTWNSGFFVNSNWYGGKMKSKSDITAPSYYTTINKGIPVQSTDFSNNKGYGYNYVLDSNIYGGYIDNGNFVNCNIGMIGPSAGFAGVTAIDSNMSGTYSVTTMGGLYNFCNINSAYLYNSTTLDTIVDNTLLDTVRTINTQVNSSYANNSEINNANAISITNADIVGYIPNYIGSTSSNSSIRGCLKLYISDDDAKRLDIFDNFYITKINKDYVISILDSDQKILLPYETRYVLDTFFDFKVNGVNQDCIVTLKNKSDNKFITEVYKSGSLYGNTYSVDTSNSASIDIDLGQYIAFYKINTSYKYFDGVAWSSDAIIRKDTVNNLFSTTSITNSDFRNGIISKSRWISGANVNYPSNIISFTASQLQISVDVNNDLLIILNESKPTINDDQLKVGTHVWLDSIYHLDNLGVQTSLSGTYSVVSYSGNQLVLNNPNNITVGGTFSVEGNPTYISIHKVKIENSEINSGMFNRTLIRNSTFINDQFDNTDRNLTNSNIDKLRFINLIFKDNNNTINNGLIHKSHIINANWLNGIANNSIWYGAAFNNGIFNDGIWINGIFNNGYFQNSPANNVIATVNTDYSYNTYYKGWYDGIFNNGFFYNSVWLNGIFNNGKLYNSEWLGGIWNNGVLGDKNIPTLNTNMGRTYSSIGATQTFWFNGLVENARIGGDGVAYWYDGKFNNGVFTSNGTSDTNQSIWYNGDFNGGNFTDLAKWKDGNFNKGKFTSYYGWTLSSTQSSDYGWEGGKFNGGQFGNGSYATNSVWYTGEFNGGIFQGRLWNSGIFQNGSFNGGGTYSNDIDFTNSFTQSYFGLWNSGWVTNIKHKAITDQIIPDINLRTTEVEPAKIAILNNLLWIDGNFDHASGTINNSVWLGGTFSSGIFKNSSFNPYVNRYPFDNAYDNLNAFNLDNSVWVNGTFDGGSFYISEWQNGNFLSGTMNGGIWRDGIWYYGYAKNIYWEKGTWKNGTWDGSPYDKSILSATNSVIPGMESDIILNVSNYANTGKVHLINSFSATVSDQLLVATNPIDLRGWQFTNTSGLLTDWTIISTISGTAIGLSNQRLGTPSFTTLQTDIDYNGYYPYVFTVGYNVSPGDTYIVSSPGLTFSKYIAVLGDTYASVISELISQMYPIVTGPYPLIDVYTGNNGLFSYGKSTNGRYYIGATPLFDGYKATSSNSVFIGSSASGFDQYFLEPSNINYSNGSFLYDGTSKKVVSHLTSLSYIPVDYSCNFTITSSTASDYELIVYQGTGILATYSFTASTTPTNFSTSTFINPSCVVNSSTYFQFEVRSVLTGSYSFTVSNSEVSITNIGSSSSTLESNQFIIKIGSNSISATNSIGPATLPYLNSEMLYPVIPGEGDFSIISDNNTVVGGYTTTSFSTTPIIYYQFTYRLAEPVLNSDIYRVDLSGSKTATATYSVGLTGSYTADDVYAGLASRFNTYIGLSASTLSDTNGSYLQLMILYSLGDTYQLKAHQSSSTTDIFTKSNAFYLFDINVTSSDGRTDFVVHLGDESYTEDIHSRTLSITNDTATYSFIRTITDNISASDKIGIERVMYSNPDNSNFIINSASLYEIDPVYNDYNNKLYQFATYSGTPFVYGTATSINLPTDIFNYASVDNQIVSLKFGNGFFSSKAGSSIWEAGIWNNGWRSVWTDSDLDYMIFIDISSVIEKSNNLWSITIDAAYDISSMITVGDKVSIGNIICIDVNEHRKIINKFYKVTNVSANGLSITVDISLNMQVRRIVRDSNNHLIYISKNIWLGGVFYNGYFKGVWNYGLLRGYPYLTKMEDSHWIDGAFDGGRYVSNMYTDTTYSTGVIQNFLFRDNNIYPTPGKFLYNSWIDVNYFTYSMTNLFKDNIRYDYDHGVVVSDGNLRGYPTLDVLSSESIFRNSYDSNSKSYSLGSKYTIYNDFLGDSAYFKYPINTNYTPGDAEFLSNGWEYTNASSDYTSNTKVGYDEGQLAIQYKSEQFPKTGIRAVQTDTFQYQSFRGNVDLNSDFTSTPLSGGYQFHINASASNNKFSNLSFTASAWKYSSIADLSNSISKYSSMPNSGLGGTNTADRRVYVIDYLQMGTMSTNSDGYDVGGGTTNNYTAITQSSNNGGSNFQFYAYECKHDTTFNVNVFIPFTFYGDDTYHHDTWDWGGHHTGNYRGGGSAFKLVGVIEKCSTAGLTGSGLTAFLAAEDNWTYVIHTKLDTFKDDNGNDTGNGFILNKDICDIIYDDNPTLIAKLYIDNVNISVVTGDYLRLRLYWIDIQKTFCSKGQDAESAAPGFLRLKIGTDPVMKYTKNNQGYLELVDNSAYYKENVNVLDSAYARSIEKYRYSLVEFDLNSFDGDVHSSITNIPTIYLLNDNYPNTNNGVTLPGNSSVINHTLTTGNKKEYFYNRKSLELFFESNSTFIAKFGKIAFYETDMIPFFRYTTEDNINKNIKVPLYGTASLIPNRGNVTFDTGISQVTDFNIDYGNLHITHTIPPTTTTTTTTTSTTTTTTTASPTAQNCYSLTVPMLVGYGPSEPDCYNSVSNVALNITDIIWNGNTYTFNVPVYIDVLTFNDSLITGVIYDINTQISYCGLPTNQLLTVNCGSMTSIGGVNNLVLQMTNDNSPFDPNMTFTESYSFNNDCGSNITSNLAPLTLIGSDCNC